MVWTASARYNLVFFFIISHCYTCVFTPPPGIPWPSVPDQMSEEAYDLVDRLLSIDPADRPSWRGGGGSLVFIPGLFKVFFCLSHFCEGMCSPSSFFFFVLDFFFFLYVICFLTL